MGSSESQACFMFSAFKGTLEQYLDARSPAFVSLRLTFSGFQAARTSTGSRRGMLA